jgi:hypothetical protein
VTNSTFFVVRHIFLLSREKHGRFAPVHNAQEKCVTSTQFLSEVAGVVHTLHKKAPLQNNKYSAVGREEQKSWSRIVQTAK